MSSTSSSSSNADTNIIDNSTNAQQDSEHTTTARRGYTVNSKAKPRKQQKQENEQPANQE
jgi:hypothetical protein